MANIRDEVRDWDGSMLHVNANYVFCRQPNWHQRLRGITHEDICVPCACKAEMEERGYAPAEPLPEGGFTQELRGRSS